MEIPETFKYIFGTVLITAIGTIFAITGNFLNIKDRFVKWTELRKKRKFKEVFKEGNPDFNFTLNYLSNPEPGKCVLRATVLNVSKEVKYIDSISYNFRVLTHADRYEPSAMFMNGEKWPKRLEHGERFITSVDFHSTLLNSLFQYWKKGVQVYATCKSTTGDNLCSNPLDFDKLVNFLKPINEDYLNLAVLLSQKTGASQRDVEASLWQLQIFDRMTVHIAKQLQQNNIPIVQYLVDKHGLVIKEDPWYHWYRDLEEKKINPTVIVGFLREIV